jgi:hypothetical protein
VLNEETKKLLKGTLLALLEEKMQIMENLIKGYQKLSQFYEDCINLYKKC